MSKPRVKISYRFLLIAPLLMLAASLATTSCTGQVNRRADAVLASAEELMESRPDSALTLLRTIAPGSISGGRRKALHALLLSQAYDKNWIDLTSDTLIAPAVAYFDRTGDADLRHRALAHYYAGRVHYNAANYPEALIHFKEAEEAALRTEDHLILGNVYSNMSYIYNTIWDHSEEAFYMKQSLNHFLQFGHPEYSDFAKIEYARTLKSKMEVDSALAILQTAIYGDSLRENIQQLAEAYTLLGTTYALLHKPDSALKYLEIACNLDSSQLDFGDWRNYIDACVEKGDIAKAEEIVRQRKSVDSTFYEPATIPLSQQDYKRAFIALSNDIRLINQRYENLSTQDISHLYSQYLNQRYYYQKREHKARTVQMLLVIALIICLSGILIYILIRKYRRKKHELSVRMSEIIALQSNINLILRQSEISSSHMSELLKSRFRELNELCASYYTADGVSDAMRRNRIARQALSSIEAFSSPEMLSELEQNINRYMGNAIAELRQEIPSIDDRNLTLLILNASGFTPVSIAVFLKMDVTNVYRTKNRIKTKIKNTDCPHKEKFIKLIS